MSKHKKSSTAAVDESMEEGSTAWWRAIKEHRAEKRAGNRESSAAVLQTRGVSFESKNGGAHLIVTYGAEVVDFWPGTGRWIFRGINIRGFGVFNLLKALDVPNTPASTLTPTAKEKVK